MTSSPSVVIDLVKLNFANHLIMEWWHIDKTAISNVGWVTLYFSAADDAKTMSVSFENIVLHQSMSSDAITNRTSFDAVLYLTLVLFIATRKYWLDTRWPCTVFFKNCS